MVRLPVDGLPGFEKISHGEERGYASPSSLESVARALTLANLINYPVLVS
jgi:hypothetical protein